MHYTTSATDEKTKHSSKRIQIHPRSTVSLHKRTPVYGSQSQPHLGFFSLLPLRFTTMSYSEQPSVTITSSPAVKGATMHKDDENQSFVLSIIFRKCDEQVALGCGRPASSSSFCRYASLVYIHNECNDAKPSTNYILSVMCRLSIVVMLSACLCVGSACPWGRCLGLGRSICHVILQRLCEAAKKHERLMLHESLQCAWWGLLDRDCPCLPAAHLSDKT